MTTTDTTATTANNHHMPASAYIAGPMTGYSEFNFPMFDRVAADLRHLGLRVISPAEMDRADGFNEQGMTGHEPLTDEQRQRFARNDIQALLDVEAIVLLPGWEQSTGASNEARVASWLGLQAFQINSESTDGNVFWYEPIDLGHKWSSVPMPDINPIDLDVVLAEDAKPNARADLLRLAESLVNGDRNAQYGDPRQDFRRTADFWSDYLGDVLGDDRLMPHDVAAMMALLKISRIRWNPTKQDSWADLAGYAACGWDCVGAP